MNGYKEHACTALKQLPVPLVLPSEKIILAQPSPSSLSQKSNGPLLIQLLAFSTIIILYFTLGDCG